MSNHFYRKSKTTVRSDGLCYQKTAKVVFQKNGDETFTVSIADVIGKKVKVITL